VKCPWSRKVIKFRHANEAKVRIEFFSLGATNFVISCFRTWKKASDQFLLWTNLFIELFCHLILNLLDQTVLKFYLTKGVKSFINLKKNLKWIFRYKIHITTDFRREIGIENQRSWHNESREHVTKNKQITVVTTILSYGI
jgi:hypothetical protein